MVQDETTVRDWFDDWKGYYGKSYTSGAEEDRAFKNFRKSMKRVKEINADSSLPFWSSGNV